MGSVRYSSSKIIAVALCLALMLTFIQGLSVYADSSSSSKELTEEEQNRVDELQNEIDKLTQQQQELQNSINAATTEKGKIQAEKDALDKQISISVQKIAALTEQIDLLNTEISDLEDNIAQTEQDIEESYDLFLHRQKSLYMSGNATVLATVLGASSYTEFLMQAEIAQRIAISDQELIDGLVAYKTQLEADKQALEEKKETVEANSAVLETERKNLATQSAAKGVEIAEVDSELAKYAGDLTEIKAKLAAMRSEMDQIFGILSNWDGEYGGSMVRPVASYSYISSTYGWRYWKDGSRDYHTGLDFAAAAGTSILAADAGIVSKVGWQGNGYGNYVIVDHGTGADGKNYKTLYAHCNSVDVVEGQEVSRGQHIAKVGSTGWSTGNHLHFEVRINGSHVNPASYVGF